MVMDQWTPAVFKRTPNASGLIALSLATWTFVNLSKHGHPFAMDIIVSSGLERIQDLQGVLRLIA